MIAHNLQAPRALLFTNCVYDRSWNRICRKQREMPALNRITAIQ